MVRKPAAVCAARSRATILRPYQKPGRHSAGRLPASGADSSTGRSSGGWDSYALQVRLDRYHSSPVSAAGTTAASASLRPGWLHQPWFAGGDRKPSQELSPAHVGRARALPGGQVEGHLAGRGDQQHGQGERDEPHEQAVGAHGPLAAGRPGAASSGRG